MIPTFTHRSNAAETPPRFPRIWLLAVITARSAATPHRKKILSQVEGVATKIVADNMSLVKQGDVILTMAGQDVTEVIVEKLDSIRSKQSQLADLKAQQSSLTICATSNGVLSELNKQAGASCSPGEWLGSIFSSDNMQLYAQVDDIDVVSIQTEATHGNNHPGCTAGTNL